MIPASLKSIILNGLLPLLLFWVIAFWLNHQSNKP